MSRFGLIRGRQSHDELGTRAGTGTERRHGTSVQLDQCLYQGEADAQPPRPLARSTRFLEKQVEEARQQGRVEPSAVVPDPQGHVSLLDPCGQLDVSTGVSKLRRVVKQVNQHLL